jgi:hypothetical protein
MKKFHLKLALVTGVFALSAAPALAVGPPSGTSGPPDNPGSGNIPANPGSGNIPSIPGPGASLPEQAKAYGVYCQDQSKTKVEGEKGTPFSKCVTAMAKLASGATDNPRKACKGESKKRVRGKKGTPFSRCVAEGAKLLRELAQPRQPVTP